MVFISMNYLKDYFHKKSNFSLSLRLLTLGTYSKYGAMKYKMKISSVAEMRPVN